MRITEIDGEYYVLRNGIKLTMTIKRMRSGELIRTDTGLLGDKKVPTDIEKAIEIREQQKVFINQ